MTLDLILDCFLLYKTDNTIQGLLEKNLGDLSTRYLIKSNFLSIIYS